MKDDIGYLIMNDWEDRLSDFFYYNRKEDRVITKKVLREYVKNNHEYIRNMMIQELDECLEYLICNDD